MNAVAKFQPLNALEFDAVLLGNFFEHHFFGGKKEHKVAKDIKQLETDWLAATHRKYIPALLNQHNTTYFGALCSFSKKVARSVSLDSFTDLITQAKKLNLPLSITLLNNTGKQTSQPVFITSNLQENCMHLSWKEEQAVLDPSQFEFAFVNRLPCDDGCGWISSLEIFGVEGELLLQVQGACEDQQAENLRLRELFSSLS